MLKQHLVSVLFVGLFAVLALRIYQKPAFNMDMLGHMANAVVLEDSDPVSIHRKVYNEINLYVPPANRELLFGHDATAPDDQNASRADRRTNPYHFAEYLPCYAIRPVYNELLRLLAKMGFSLVQATKLISTASYFFLGILIFIWLRRYLDSRYAATFSLLLMICPPIKELGQLTTSDCLSTAVTLASLYLIFEHHQFAIGVGILLASIYVRTDNAILTGLVVVGLLVQKQLDFWKAGALLLVALGSVLAINHFSGDYGMKMLYYRNFIGNPPNPGEFVAQFTPRDYLRAFRSGITNTADGFFLPFFFAGLAGFLRPGNLVLKIVGALMCLYLLLHFILLPNYVDRWFGGYYIAMGMLAAGAIRAVGLSNAHNKTGPV
jgi:hypothetical protein